MKGWVMSENILFVDDDINILQAFRRQYSNQFSIDTAQGPEEALGFIHEKEPYAVVVSDLRMPKMDGIEFLAKVQESSPNTIRVMLTGYADLNTAIAAVNQGNVFRFLTKPVRSDELVQALSAALEQYRLVTAEKELLEKTLKGSVKLLVDLLSLLNPGAFSRATQSVRYVRQIVSSLNIPDAWQYELAALLSHIGWVTLPPEIPEKPYSNDVLTVDEKKRLESCPTIARNLLINIPRLELVAKMIERQHFVCGKKEQEEPLDKRDPISLGAQILKVALDYSLLISRGYQPERAIEWLRSQPLEYERHIVDGLEISSQKAADTSIRILPLDQIHPGMILNQDVYTENGTPLVIKGQEITDPVLEMLNSRCQLGEISGTLQVITSAEFRSE